MFVLFICSILTTAAQVAQAHSAQSNETDWMQHNIPLASDKYIKNLTDVFLNMKDVSRKNQIDIAKNLSAPDAGECGLLWNYLPNECDCFANPNQYGQFQIQCNLDFYYDAIYLQATFNPCAERAEAEFYVEEVALGTDLF